MYRISEIFQKFVKNQKSKKSKFRLLQCLDLHPVSICAKFEKLSNVNGRGVANFVKVDGRTTDGRTDDGQLGIGSAPLTVYDSGAKNYMTCICPWTGSMLVPSLKEICS